MANWMNTTSASTLKKCEALLQEALTELISSVSNSEGIAPRPVSKLTTFLSFVIVDSSVILTDARRRSV